MLKLLEGVLIALMYLPGSINDGTISKECESKPVPVLSNTYEFKKIGEFCEDNSYHAMFIGGYGEYAVLSIQNGTITSGTFQSGGSWYTWTNALVKAYLNNNTMSFRADFSGSSYDSTIMSVYSPYTSFVNASLNLWIEQSHATGNQNSLAIFQVSTSCCLYNLHLCVPAGNANPSAILQY